MQRQLAWVDTRQGTQPVTVKTHIQKKQIKALVHSGADEDYIHWKTAKELGLKLKKKREPYILYGIGGNETQYNKGMVTQETGLIHIQFNRQKRKKSFDITHLGDHQIILRRRWLKKENPWIDWTTEKVRIKKEALQATATLKQETQLPKHQP